ncbi:MAG: helix-turn-helix domain-containing protein [Ruminococcaceae bacterium]|nr:helix-turn-helix domain-containing protein [Oscillospiraceae bacterium]
MEYERIATCADRIKEALYIKGMKQSDLCRLTQIPKSAISQYISGAFEPKQDRIYLIAKSLNVSEAWLMGLDVPMERQDRKSSSPSEPVLSEGEKAILELFRQVPEDKQQLVLQMIRAALGNR